MDAKTKATIGLTAVLALGVGGGVTYAAAGQDQPDTVRVQTVSEDAAPVEQPSPSPSTSQAPVEQPAEKQRPVEQQPAQPVQQPAEKPANEAPAADSAPAPEPKDEPVTQPQKPAEQPKASTDDGGIPAVKDSEGRAIRPAHPAKVEANDPAVPNAPGMGN